MQYGIIRYLLLAGALSLTGCSFGPSRTADSIPLKSRKNTTAWELQQISSSPRVYKRKSLAGESYNVFMTAIQECPVREERSSIATTRSLLVGLRDIKIRRQEEVNLGGLPTLLSVFDATVDDQPIALALYTVRKGECVKDYVAWVTDQVDSDPSIVAAHLELELPEFAELVSNTLSGDTPDFSSLALSNGESALEVN